MSELEYCCECDEATGNAGAGEDSLHIETSDNLSGPYCSSCHESEVERILLNLTDKEALIQEMNNLDLLLPGDGFEVYVKLSDVEKIIRGVK